VIRLLGRKTSGNVQKVIWLLDELGLAYQREDFGRQFNNNTQSETYLKLNPNAKVPTLVDGDLAIWESNTILRYLATKSGRFMPADPGARTQAERWMDWQLASLNGPYLAVFRESKTAPAERSAGFADQAAAMGKELQILDGALAGRDWLGGKEMTVAEFCLGPIVHRCLNFGVTLPALGNVRRWYGQFADRPAFKAAVAG
jgi:glutathione S-transferase